MCGIAGIINYKKQGRISERGLSRMLNALRHRGPDGYAKVIHSHVAMGMTRLAIIDLKGGMQPLYNEDKTVEVICNGEIYNYKELQKSLTTKKHKFRTSSDVETIAHLYEDFGLGFVKKLRGMFAITLFDKTKQRVVLVRDRMGEKPIYYSDVNGSLVFSSEMKSILKYGKIHKEINYSAINKYFHFSYVPEPETVFVNVKKLPAGSFLVADLSKRSYFIRNYWNAGNIKAINADDPTRQIKRITEEACSLCLRADVEVGIALSGGIDSGAILALSAPQYKDLMLAFTVGYEGSPRSDERVLAGIITKKFNVRHIQKEIKKSEFVDYFPNLIYDSDDPIADIAGYSIYSVSKLARKNGIKVILNGIGGDELFWGYPWIRKFIQGNVLNREKDKHNFYLKSRFFKLAKSFTTKIFSQELAKESVRTFENIARPADKSKLAVARNSQNLERDPWLISNCIDLNDRLSMANSIELRSPLLDYKLVELAYSSKKNVLSYDKAGKYWFKRALAGLIPNSYLDLPKRGFNPPVAEWYFALIKRYRHLLKDGFLVKSRILSRNKLKLSFPIMMLNPLLWDVYYQFLVLEVWGREYVWGQTPNQIKYARK